MPCIEKRYVLPSKREILKSEYRSVGEERTQSKKAIIRSIG